jgi:hypothetical protein
MRGSADDAEIIDSRLAIVPRRPSDAPCSEAPRLGSSLTTNRRLSFHEFSGSLPLVLEEFCRQRFCATRGITPKTIDQHLTSKIAS